MLLLEKAGRIDSSPGMVLTGSRLDCPFYPGEAGSDSCLNCFEENEL